MSIASEITRLQGVKSDILQAISDKGVTVPAGAGLDDVAGLIEDIPTGGGNEPLPENWVRVSGLKTRIIGGPWWVLNDVINENSDDLTSECIWYIDPFAAQPMGSFDRTPTLSLFCDAEVIYFSYNGVNYFAYLWGNGLYANQYNQPEPSGGIYGGVKNVICSKGTLKIDGNTYNFGNYQQRQIKQIFVGGPATTRDANTYVTFIEGYLKKNDNILAHLIPVKNTVTNKPGIFDTVSGSLLNQYITDSELQGIEIIE